MHAARELWIDRRNFTDDGAMCAGRDGRAGAEDERAEQK
jgi:hypothetical protein